MRQHVGAKQSPFSSKIVNLNTTPASNRINPAESRYLRQQVAATHTPCQSVEITIHTVVVAAKVAHNMDLSQEARALRLELQLPTALTSSY